MILSQINIYPIKSLQGISLQEAEFDEEGLKFDRRWMLVDEEFEFLTQREYPQMAGLRTELADSKLRVIFAGDFLEIPLYPNTERRAIVRIWESDVEALVYEDEINHWFSDALGIKCKLVRISGKRRVDPKYAVSNEDRVAFADGYPFLLTNEASLRELNKHLETPVEMNRFRPNLVISAEEPFAEDRWFKLKIGNCIFYAVKPCSRCVITTIDQKTGQKLGDEPLRTLSKIRLFEIEGKKKAMFGQNLIAKQKSGRLKVGDSVEVMSFKTIHS